MSKHLADRLDAYAFAERPGGESVASDVHGQIKVNVGHVGDELKVLVALLVTHQVQTVIVLAKYIHCLRQKNYGIRYVSFQSFVLDAVIVALLDDVLLAYLDKVRVRKPRVAGEDEHIADFLNRAVTFQSSYTVAFFFCEEFDALGASTRYAHCLVRITGDEIELQGFLYVRFQAFVITVY